MHIALVTAEYPPQQGGVGDYTREIARELARQGETVCVITTAPTSSWTAPVKTGATPDDAAHTGDVNEPFTVRRLIPAWDWRCWSHLAAATVTAEVIQIEYQTAAYAMHPAINLFPRWLRWRRGHQAPHIAITFHDLKVPYLFPKAGPVRSWITGEPARQCDLVIATNEEDYVTLQQQLGPTMNLALIPIGSNIPHAPPPDYDRAAWRQRLGIAPGELLLVYFGFLNASKGGETLADTLHLLRQQGLPARLLMCGGRVGSSDPSNLAYMQYFTQRLRTLNLDQWVIWTEFQAAATVSGHLLAADLAVLPYTDGASYRRGSLMAVLTHGLPLITTLPTPQHGDGGKQELGEHQRTDRPAALPKLRHGENVWLVPPRDPAATATAVTHLWRDPASRARLSAGATALARAFTWERIVAQHRAAYDALATRPVRSPKPGGGKS